MENYRKLQCVCMKVNLVAFTDEDGRNCLQRAVIENRSELVVEMLELVRLGNHSVDEVICHQDKYYRSSLDDALVSNNAEILFTLLFALSSKWLARLCTSSVSLVKETSLVQLLRLTEVCKAINLVAVVNGRGQNALQHAVRKDDTEFALLLLQLVRHSGQSTESLVVHKDQLGQTALQYAVLNNNSRLVDGLLTSLTQKSRDSACQIVDKSGNNLLHLAAGLSAHSENLVSTVASLVNSCVVKKLIKQTNLCGEKPKQLKAAMLIRSHVPMLVWPILTQSAQNSLLMAITTLAVKADNSQLMKELGCWFPRITRCWLNTNLAKVPISTDVLQIFSALSDRFILPTVQSKARKWAFVCYNPLGRKGAHREAKDLCTALESIGFSVKLHEWQCFGKLRSWLVDRIDEIRHRCSVVTLCLLSHGAGGKLIGSDNSSGGITEIIDEARKAIPIAIPIVVLVQACRKADVSVSSYESSEPTRRECNRHSEQEDVVVVPKDDANHLILRGQNCVVLMATLYDNVAYRGHFTSAVSKELRKANKGTPNIQDIFMNASHKMSLHKLFLYKRQTPEFRSSLRRHLFL